MMKHKIGMFATLIGILLLIRPNFDIRDFVEASSYLLVRYWPIILIAFGVFLQSSNKTKRKRR
ncbi:MAG: hypothetical protein EOM50_09710 [Erysipelotrichia bacterium]|nr:hypothetical protein [Erysipelotrichia bacterium]